MEADLCSILEKYSARLAVAVYYMRLRKPSNRRYNHCPLLALPILQNCALRLAREYDKELQNMAETTVVSLTGGSIPQSLRPFKFLNLSKEIQLNILQHTRLVYSDDTACSQDCMRFGGYCPAQRSASSTIAPNSRLLKCFCCKSHSAFSFSCDSCETLGFPLALFLVNRQFRDAAIEVFYGSNKFAVSMIDLDHSTSTTAQIHQSFSIVPAFERFPKYALRFFTSLRLVFIPSDLEHFQPDQAGWKTWLNTVHMLSQEANLAVLNLGIRLEEKYYFLYSDMEKFDIGYKERMWETYRRLIQLLTSLRGLKNFFVHLNWASTICLPKIGALEGREEIEGKLERIVMGDEYNAWKCGKVVRMEGPGCDY